MNPLDDIFRDGLAGRKAEVPDGLWERIAAQQPGQVPTGERVDHVFKDALANRRAAVPAGMWDRIVAARTTAPHSGRQLLATLLVFLLIGLVLYGVQVGEERGETALPTASLQEERSEKLEAGSEKQEMRQPVGVGDGAQVQGASNTIIPPVDPGVEGAVADPARSRTAGVAITTEEARPTEIASVVPAATAADGEETAAPTPNRATLHPRAVAPLSPLPRAAAPLLLTSFHPLVLPLKRTTKIRATGGFQPIGSNRLHGELLLGTGYTNQSLTARTDEQQLQQEEREVTEFPEASLRLSARLRYRLSPRLRLTTGLTYAALRNRFEYDQVIDGTPTFLRRTNKLRMLEVPLLLSYELPGRRLRVALNGGVVVNALTSVSGLYQDPGTLEPQSLAASGYYRRSVGLGYTTSLTAAYPILDGRLQLLLEPYFQAYPRSFTTGAAPVAERYWTAGLQLGVRKVLR